MLDLNRPIQTRSGKRVRIIATDVKGDTENKIIALVDHGDEEILAIRTVDGFILPDSAEHPEDFVNVPLREKLYVSVGTTYSHHSSAVDGEWPVLVVEVEYDGDIKNISRVVSAELSK